MNGSRVIPATAAESLAFSAARNFSMKPVEFLLQGRRGDGFLRRLGEGGSKVHESGCEHNSQQKFHGSAPSIRPIRIYGVLRGVPPSAVTLSEEELKWRDLVASSIFVRHRNPRAPGSSV